MGSDKVVRDAELPEISVVFEGMDASAVFSLLFLKSIGGGEKLNPEETNRSFDISQEDITDAFDKRGCGLYPLLKKMSIESWELTENMVDPSAAAENYPRSNGSRKVKSEPLASYVEVARGDVLRLRNTPADLVTYLTDELPARLVNMIEKSVLFPSVDATGTSAALFSVMADATTDVDQLSSLMASSVEASDTTPTIADLINLNALVAADGPRVLVTSRQTLAAAQLSAAGGGSFVVMGPDVVASVLGVDKVLTPSWWTDDSQLGAEAIIMATDHYLVIGGDVNSDAQCTLDSNTDKNTDKFRSELLVGGSLDSAHAAAVLTPKA